MDEAIEVCDRLLSQAPQLKAKVTELKAAILYEKNEFQPAITTLKSL